MTESTRVPLAFSVTLLVTGFFIGTAVRFGADVAAQSRGRVFEIRTYTAADGKLDALHARFRDHTMRLFERHGMTNVGYWSPQDAPLAANTLMYILAHPSREAAAANWEAFRKDPEWQKVRAASEVQGPIVAKTESIFLNATDYSPMR